MYGIIGYPLDHSWSPDYFKKKFSKAGIAATYQPLPLNNIKEFPNLLKRYPNLRGLNVTLPYKEVILKYLDAIDPQAEKIGAVNCIKIVDGKTHGYNTDMYGFKSSLFTWLPDSFNSQALILGTGGASKAVAAALKALKIPFQFVSRKHLNDTLNYEDLSWSILQTHHLIINATPLGMSPNLEGTPPIPYSYLSSEHFLFDLIYNPKETLFLKFGKEKEAQIKNGEEMLVLQAEASWNIWNNKE